MAADTRNPSYNLTSLEILVIEENPFLQRMMRGILREFNFLRVRLHSDPDAGFNLFKNYPADLVFMGWSPAQEQLRFLDTVRNHEDSPNRFVPLIVFSAFSEEHQVKRARDMGMTEFLALPVSPRTVYGRLCAVIEHPRPFVRSPDFFGPDRRRRQIPFEGAERRVAEPEIELPEMGGTPTA